MNLVAAANVDTSKLPPPATRKIEFEADIKPILDSNCLRCHGVERPKSGFRLTDRASALKGGANGVDIIPGNSAESPLIHYVARVVPDMEMPPEGKGTPLVSNDVALLRAWIDQGALWDSSPAEETATYGLSPMLSWTSIHGDRSKFRELEWQPGGWNGGAENFEFHRRLTDGRSASIGGHALVDDYRLTLDLRKPELGFTRFHFEQYRRYYSDAGGYHPAFSQPLFRLADAPHLDIGRAEAEAGLTLPDWPKIVLGYEYQYKDGSKSMLTWGPVQPASGNFLDIRNLYPSAKEIDEHTHVLRLDMGYDLHGYEFENRLRAEFYDSATRRTDALSVAAGSAEPSLLLQVREAHRYTHVADTLGLHKQITEWWLAGAGYRYSWLEGDAALRLSPEANSGQAAAGSAWFADKILLDEVWQIANAHSQFRPLPQLSTTLAVQGQWKRQDTFGDVNLDEVLDPADPTSGIFRFPAMERSALDQSTAEETLLVRYTGLPFTSLFGEALLKQEDYRRAIDQEGGPHDVQLASDADVRWQDYRVGFSSSPWRRITFGGHYRHRDRETDYDYALRQGGGAYPGFITAREILSDELEGRVVVHPAAWLKTTLTYRWTDSDFRTTTAATSPADAGSDATPGGGLVAGRYEAHTASGNATLTPIRRLHFSGTVSWQNSRTITFDNDSPSVAPYAGDLWSLLASATYVLSETTDLVAGYTRSQAWFGQHNEIDGLPLGLDYCRQTIQAGVVRRLGKHATARLQYNFFDYSEPSSDHLRDYTAHQVLAVLGVKW